MSADILRRAARRARMDSFNGGDKFLDAVADWLDDHAETAEMFVSKEIPASAWSMSWQTSHNRALAAARAYLGDDQ